MPFAGDDSSGTATRALESIARLGELLPAVGRDPTAPLQAIADEAHQLFDAKMTAIALHTPASEALRLVAGSGELPDDAFEMRIPTSDSPGARAIESREPVVIGDFSEAAPGAQQTATAFGLRSAIFLPLGSDGVLVIGSDKVQRFSESDVAVAALFAGLARTAVTVSRRSVVAESERLAAELHDSTMQLLYAALMNLEAAKKAPPGEAIKKLSKSAEIIRDGVGELRILAVEASHASEPLSDRLRHIAAQLGRDVRIEVEASGADLPPSHPSIDQLSRIALEATSNAVRHSGSERVLLRLEGCGDSVCLTIRDWGEGFEPGRVAKGLGLTGLPKRAEAAGGELHIDSAPGRGTTVSVRAPIGGARTE